jgi:hypothetical protein
LELFEKNIAKKARVLDWVRLPYLESLLLQVTKQLQDFLIYYCLSCLVAI